MKLITIIFSILLFFQAKAQETITTDVLVIGGGTGGTAAGIQSARNGARTIIVEPSPWLGGMISAAGVSAIDGNHRLPSGLWEEFRMQIYKVYGGPKAVETGWVSNMLFEPHVADSIFKSMAAREKLLSVYYLHSFKTVSKSQKKISTAIFRNKKSGQLLTIKAKVFIDATELGDVMKAAGVPYDLGMEAGETTGENVGVQHSNDIVQDLTYVATLKDFGKGTDNTIKKPANYNPAEFDGACTDYYTDKSRKAPTVDAKKMLDYGRLPNNKYMLNWPGYGNDTYLNVVELSEEEREKELVKAKETTLRFVYFIQQQLGYKNLGLAKDEFPTADELALMPYHREGRRLRGLVRLNMTGVAEPFRGEPLYRTGISVGDYPIDHHHKKNTSAPQHLEFYPIPSFNIPLGALIPTSIDNLVVAEKGISVSNVVNGTTRLQPCVLLTGQAAGVLAALSIKRLLAPKAIAVRQVQQTLLSSRTYIMPYIDITPDHPHWEMVQKIGATGILKGKGIPFKWANQTWFYPDSLVHSATLVHDLNNFQKGSYNISAEHLKIAEAILIAFQLRTMTAKTTGNKNPQTAEQVAQLWNQWGLENFSPERKITRLELAVLLQNIADPFSMKPIDHKGYCKTN